MKTKKPQMMRAVDEMDLFWIWGAAAEYVKEHSKQRNAKPIRKALKNVPQNPYDDPDNMLEKVFD